MDTLQKAALRYRSELIVPVTTATNEDEVVSAALLAAFLRNVEAFGFQLSPEIIKQAMALSTEDFKAWAVDVITALKEVKGANYAYNPMYPNFPTQVAEASDIELFTNAILHYFGDMFGARIMPVYEKEERFPFYEDTVLTTLNLAKGDIVESIFANLLGSKVSFSETDTEMLENLYLELDLFGFIRALDSGEIPNKENFAHLAKIVRGDADYTAAVLNRATTVTDLLRVGAVYSDAHPSLKDKFRFGKLSRPERRAIVLNLVRLDTNYLEDFNRNREMWKRFTERLHVGEFISGDHKLLHALGFLRSSKTIPTWGTKVEKALLEGDYTTSVSALAKRPGELARRLNQLLDGAASDEVEFVVSQFKDASTKVSTTVLLQVIAFFRTLKENPDRKFSTLFTASVKGGAFALPREKSDISASVCDEVIQIATDALHAIYAQRESLGKVFYDFDGSYNPVVPFGLRNTSNAFRVVGRGTRSTFDVDKTLRFFIHWKDQKSEFNGYDNRVDLDLSAVFLDEEFNEIGVISYYNLREYGAVHSGDITSAPRGASEFIDVDLKAFRKANPKARYISMTVNSYTRQKFSELDEVLAGFMTRKDVQSGEIYEPKSVENAFTVNSASTAVIPMVFDVVEGVSIFTDVAINGRSHINNASRMHRSTKNVLTGLVGKKTVNYDDVISANLAARAELVSTAEDADIVIKLRDGESSISFDEFLAKWL
jgi:stress response protein SCP2